jgi:hypothetical protein
MSDWKPRMQKTVRHLAEQPTGIRSGTLIVGFVQTFRISKLHHQEITTRRRRGDAPDSKSGASYVNVRSKVLEVIQLKRLRVLDPPFRHVVGHLLNA